VAGGKVGMGGKLGAETAGWWGGCEAAAANNEAGTGTGAGGGPAGDTRTVATEAFDADFGGTEGCEVETVGADWCGGDRFGPDWCGGDRFGPDWPELGLATAA
jgi:hypothetical protein